MSDQPETVLRVILGDRYDDVIEKALTAADKGGYYVSRGYIDEDDVGKILAAVLPDLLAEANTRAEDAEAKARRFANLLGNNAKALNDALPREVLRQKVEAWDECTRAWEAYLSGASGNVPPLNPYRHGSEWTEAGA